MKQQWTGFRSVCGPLIERYLCSQRALSRRYDTEEAALRLFDRYLFEHALADISGITGELLEAFVGSRPRTRPRSYNQLLGVVRRWLDWAVRQNELAIAPVYPRPRPATSQRLPFLFDQTLARRLLQLAEKLPDRPKGPARAATYRMIFRLLYGLGLRVGEVARLCLRDVDLQRQLLVIRETKFSKSRLVPFGPSIGDELQRYILEHPKPAGTQNADSPLFSFYRNLPINPYTITQTFHQLLPGLNLTIPPGVSPPRLHHLRHSFAVATLLRWYRTGVDPAARLGHLSTFLGHVDPVSTAVYLTITGELLDEANQRFERFACAGMGSTRT